MNQPFWRKFWRKSETVDRTEVGFHKSGPKGPLDKDEVSQKLEVDDMRTEVNKNKVEVSGDKEKLGVKDRQEKTDDRRNGDSKYNKDESLEKGTMERLVMAFKEMASLTLRPKNFDGKEGNDPEMFFKKLDRLAAYGQWPEERKANIVPLLLDDKASEYYENLQQDVKDDYDQVKLNIIDHFSPNKHKLVRYRELSQKCMTLDQTVADFHDSLKRDATKIGNISDEQVMLMFINGLPRAIRDHVALQNPENMNSALKMARDFESLKYSRQETDDLKSLAAGLSEEKFESLVEENRKLKKQMEELREKLKAFESGTKPQQGKFSRLKSWARGKIIYGNKVPINNTAKVLQSEACLPPRVCTLATEAIRYGG